jgi:ABC-type transport system substrate-binding protein
VALKLLLLTIVSLSLFPSLACNNGARISDQKDSRERVDGGTLIGLLREPTTLDPHQVGDSTSASIVVEVFGGLVTLDPDLNVIPDLAETWDVGTDGMTYIFHLREDARFHDGKPVTAQDFKWSMERATDPLGPALAAGQYLGDIVGVGEKLGGRAGEVTGVQVIDQNTLEITIDAPKSYFLAKLTYPVAFVLDRENVESARWPSDPNGTGPFKLADYQPKERLALARNQDFHLGPPFLEEVHFILSGGHPLQMYENDEVHLAAVGLASLDRLLDSTDPLNAELHKIPPSFSTIYIGMSVSAPPLDDAKVRQALNYAIDRESISRDFHDGLLTPARGILPPGFPGYNPDLQGYPYNPDKARELLRESKYGADPENLPPITLTVPGALSSGLGLSLELVLEMWRENLGVRVDLLRTDTGTYLRDLSGKRFQMFRTGWVADYPDPENFLGLLFHSASRLNHTGYSNPEVDKLIEGAESGPQDMRYELYRRAEEMIVEDAPWVPLWHSGGGYLLIKPHVRDYFLVPVVIPKLRYVYMTEK